MLLVSAELKQLTDFLATRHQDEPRVLGIVHQQQAAQGKITDGQGVLLKSWIQGEHTGLSCSAVGNSRLAPCRSHTTSAGARSIAKARGERNSERPATYI
ncbi:hypothetical protein D3C78_1787120 [compost metagenome]